MPPLQYHAYGVTFLWCNYRLQIMWTGKISWRMVMSRPVKVVSCISPAEKLYTAMTVLSVN